MPREDPPRAGVPTARITTDGLRSSLLQAAHVPLLYARAQSGLTRCGILQTAPLDDGGIVGQDLCHVSIYKENCLALRLELHK